MMGITVPETSWAYHKYNKTISSIYLVIILQLSQRCTVQYTSKERIVIQREWASKQLAVKTIRDKVTDILIFLMHTYQENIKTFFTGSDGENVNSM